MFRLLMLLSNFFLRKVDLLAEQFLNNFLSFFLFFCYVSKIEDVLFSATWMTTKLTLMQEANRIITVRNLGQEVILLEGHPNQEDHFQAKDIS